MAITAMAPMSSTMASVSKNSLSIGGIREPSSATTPTANAMSVAIGMPQPDAASPDGLSMKYSSAGATIPPIAAIAGSVAARTLARYPVTSSRLISRPTTKKNNAMSASFTNSSSVSGCR